jgi:hypothetical protein
MKLEIKQVDSLRFVLACLTLFLPACAEDTSQLRASTNEKASFQLETPYSEVYQTYLANAHACYKGGTPASYFYVEDRQNDARTEGSIDIIQDGLARRVLVSSDIVADGNNTDVTYYINTGFDFLHTLNALPKRLATTPHMCLGRL